MAGINIAARGYREIFVARPARRNTLGKAGSAFQIDVEMEENHFVRHIHFKNSDGDVYMLSNESTLSAQKVKMKVKNRGNCNIYDLLADAYYSYECDGEIELTRAEGDDFVISFSHWLFSFFRYT